MNSTKMEKGMTLKDELPRLVGAQYADMFSNMENSGEITPEIIETEPKQKQHPVVDVMGDGSKVRCCKEQYCIGMLSP